MRNVVRSQVGGVPGEETIRPPDSLFSPFLLLSLFSRVAIVSCRRLPKFHKAIVLQDFIGNGVNSQLRRAGGKNVVVFK